MAALVEEREVFVQRERPGADMAPRIAALLADTPGQGIDTLRWTRARVTMAGTHS